LANRFNTASKLLAIGSSPGRRKRKHEKKIYSAGGKLSNHIWQLIW